jgi:nitrate/nitrite-specific signal transduction histidine kinase
LFLVVFTNFFDKKNKKLFLFFSQGSQKTKKMNVRDAEQQEDPLAEVVGRLLQYQNLFRIYHWQTHSYARHKASDELLSSFTDLIDQLVEGLQGAHNKRVKFGRPATFKVSDVSDVNATGLVADLKKWLEHLQDEIALDIGISNTRDEIVSLLDKTLYLFTLN